MKHVYPNVKAVLFTAALISTSFIQAQNPTTVVPGSLCNVVEDFNQSAGGFHSPSIYTESDYTEFHWDATKGYMVETSNLSNRSASMISGVYLNKQLTGIL